MNKYIHKGTNLKRFEFLEENINYLKYAIKEEKQENVLKLLNMLLDFYKKEFSELKENREYKIMFWKNKCNSYLCVEYKGNQEYIKPIEYIKDNNRLFCKCSVSDKYTSGITTEFKDFDIYDLNDLEIYEITKEEFINRAKNGIDNLINN